MKAFIFEPNGFMTVDDIPEATIPDSDWLKIRVKTAGLCGSDLHKLLNPKSQIGYLKTKILGHEISGIVVECGAKVTDFKTGDRVAVEPLLYCGYCKYCQQDSYQLCSNILNIGRDMPGGFAEYVCVPQKQVYSISPEISFDQGALIDSVAVGIHCIHLTRPRKRKWNIAIIGDGTIGLVCLQVAKAFGATELVLFGKYKSRLKLAQNLGANKAFILGKDSQELSSLKSSFDVVIESVGGKQSATLQSSIDLVAPGGIIGVIGVFDFDFMGTLPLRKAFYKEIQIKGINSYSTWNKKSEFEIAIQLIADGLVDVKPLITHKLPLSDFYKALNIAKRKEETGMIKLLFQI